MKKIIILLMLVCLVGCVNEVQDVVESEVVDQPIGGQKDEHGCLGPAGYSYDSEIGACTRNWELDENQAKAAKIAVDYLGKEGTIINVDVMRCPGCFNVQMQLHNGSTINIIIENWKIVENIYIKTSGKISDEYEAHMLKFTEKGNLSVLLKTDKEVYTCLTSYQEFEKFQNDQEFACLAGSMSTKEDIFQIDLNPADFVYFFLNIEGETTNYDLELKSE